MANTIIQILRSYETETPSNLADGSLAYSFVSNTLFIGSETESGNAVYAIGGNSLVNLTQSAFDAANTKVSRDGDTMNGALQFFGSEFAVEIGRAHV